MNRSMIRLVALAGAAAVALAACGDDGDTTDETTPAATGSPAADTSPATGTSPAADASVAASFVTPADGATVTSPVDVQMQATGIDIAPAADAVEGAGHFHIMVDTTCVETGEVIPSDDAHRHFGDGSTTASLELAAGEHTLCLQLGDNNHSAVGSTDEITITVE